LEELANLDTSLVILISVVWLVQVALMLWALIDIVRRPSETIRGAMKWPWILLVLFVNLIGPVIYLAVGRITPAVPDEPHSALERDKTQHAVDALYGDDSEQ